MTDLDDLLFHRLPDDATAICPSCRKQPVLVIGEIKRSGWVSGLLLDRDRIVNHVLSCCGYAVDYYEYIVRDDGSTVWFFRPYLIRKDDKNDTVDTRARED